eukprot:TRINITY_DN66657_c6_g1_i3.p1 TRINITY_DN66657_c6_g1~~TRINITY_DN66657_c6_g1_i3.p1  ORF type:complete len:206 (-),score=38.00 TRINITY_DN66657_c6_g1_i3:126-743(-)
MSMTVLPFCPQWQQGLTMLAQTYNKMVPTDDEEHEAKGDEYAKWEDDELFEDVEQRYLAVISRLVKPALLPGSLDGFMGRAEEVVRQTLRAGSELGEEFAADMFFMSCLVNGQLAAAAKSGTFNEAFYDAVVRSFDKVFSTLRQGKPSFERCFSQTKTQVQSLVRKYCALLVTMDDCECFDDATGVEMLNEIRTYHFDKCAELLL